MPPPGDSLDRRSRRGSPPLVRGAVPAAFGASPAAAQARLFGQVRQGGESVRAIGGLRDEARRSSCTERPVPQNRPTG